VGVHGGESLVETVEDGGREGGRLGSKVWSGDHKKKVGRCDAAATKPGSGLAKGVQTRMCGYASSAECRV